LSDLLLFDESMGGEQLMTN